MENMNQDHSRMDRFEKKRRDTKMITLFGILGGLLIIVLIFLFIFNDPPQDEALPATGTNEEQESNNNKVDDSLNEGTNDQEQENNEPSDTNENTNQSENQQDSSNEQVQVNSDSDDPNVIETYTNEAWEPIGTAQDEPHSPSLDKESVDWKELRQAIGYAVELQPDDLILWWVTHGETNQERVATVTNLQQDEDKIYRVTLTWIENQGYKPILVERLKENDQKYRFEENNNENEQDTEVE